MEGGYRGREGKGREEGEGGIVKCFCSLSLHRALGNPEK